MTFNEFIKQIKNFSALNLSDRILFAGYYLHTEKKVERFNAAAINALFDLAHLERPSNTSSQMTWLANSLGKRLLKDSKGFRLNSTVRDRISTATLTEIKAEPKQATVDLQRLEALVNDPWQRTFLHETIVCFENRAYRASIVMAWNLAYYHSCQYILNGHLEAFNKQLKAAYPKKDPVTKHSDFEDLKEGQVIEVAKGARIFSVSTAKTLIAKVDKRNTAAHPSSTVILPITAEEFISDLVQNIILKDVL